MRCSNTLRRLGRRAAALGQDATRSLHRPALRCGAQFVVACAAALLLCATSLLAYEDLDTLLDLDPFLNIPAPEQAFEDDVKALWIAAMKSPEADVRRRAAEGFYLARREGYKGLEDAIPALTALLDKSETHRAVRLSAARALAALDARKAAPLLQQEAEQGGLNAALMTEPALARWQYEPMLEVWRSRIADPKTPRRYLILALECLGVMKDAEAEESLRAVVRDATRAPDVRLAAARGLAQIQPNGLLELAKVLYSQPEASVLDRTLAAALLGEHRDEATIEFLAALAIDQQPAVANLALEQLFEVAPQRIIPLAETLLASRDVNVRLWAAKAIALEPNAQHLVLLQQRLVDPHPELRAFAREALLKFANEAGLRDEVIAAAVETLSGEDWRGLEQSARIVGMLDHKPSANRLLELLTEPRDEVGVTAAWGLRKLSVAETLQPALDYCQRAFEQLRKIETGPLQGNLNDRTSQLIQHFGVHRFAPAEPLLRGLVPKQSLPGEPRGAAVWALGHYYQEKAPEGFCSEIIERLNDIGGVPPEDPRVRQMAAITLGRIKCESGVPSLRKFYELEGSNSALGYACGWAIEAITGEEVALPGKRYRYPQGLFLQPYRE